MPIFKSVLTKIIIEKNKNIKFNNKKAYCHLSRNIILHSAIKDMGIVKKKDVMFLGLTLSLKKNSYRLKFNLIKSSANLENLYESGDM